MAFEGLTEKINSTFKKLRGKGRLKESDVKEAMREIRMALLFDTYGGMLTEKQRECFDMRYNQDLSLGEIADMMGVSRQAVNDNLKKTEALLRRMEENIGSVKRDMLIRRTVQELLDAATVLDTSSDPTVQAAKQRIIAAAHMLEE